MGTFLVLYEIQEQPCTFEVLKIIDTIVSKLQVVFVDLVVTLVKPY